MLGVPIAQHVDVLFLANQVIDLRGVTAGSQDSGYDLMSHNPFNDVKIVSGGGGADGMDKSGVEVFWGADEGGRVLVGECSPEILARRLDLC